MQYRHTCSGTCSRYIDFEINDGKVHAVHFVYGCDGNAKGISALVEGMEAGEVIRRLNGITCELKGTSCPDQLAKAVSVAIEKNAKTRAV